MEQVFIHYITVLILNKYKYLKKTTQSITRINITFYLKQNADYNLTIVKIFFFPFLNVKQQQAILTLIQII